MYDLTFFPNMLALGKLTEGFVCFCISPFSLDIRWVPFMIWEIIRKYVRKIMHIHGQSTSSVKYTDLKEKKKLKHGENLVGILGYCQKEGPQQELVMAWVWILGNLKTESVAKALCQASALTGTTNTAPGQFTSRNQTMGTSQEGFWAPRDHDHDHCSPLLQIQTEMLPSQNCPSLESKALEKETCFH